ncbi:hypothetical protein Taro_024680 [Colocasia esculenta]|uniref:Uncharacterized protein n=1 Tax=Colocasia esculenta TaxID=4460 RepID=A0A843V6Y0_COLES|nr:hypothetical protein [Colocasia esculenta]
MLNATGRYVAFISEGGTLVVATLWRQVGRHLLVQKATPLWSHSGYRVSGCDLYLGWPKAVLGVFGRCAVCACAYWFVLVTTSCVVCLWWLPRQFSFRPDPHPWEPVEGVLRATSVLELETVLADSRAEGKTVVGSGVESFVELPYLNQLVHSHCLSLRWFRSHVVVSGVGPQLDWAAVVCVWCVLCGSSLASLYRGGCRQESVAGELEVWTVCPPCSCHQWQWLGCSCCDGGSHSGLTWLLRCSVSLLSRRVHAKGCFRIVFDSAGSAGVLSGPTLVVGRGITLLRCFVVLCSSLLPLSLEFLLLWLTVPCSLLSDAVLPQGLRCAVCLAGAFWQVFPERCLGGSGGGSPRTCLRCFCSSACCSVFSNGPCCWPFGLCVLVKVLPRIAPLLILEEVLPRSAQCLFWATVVLPLWFEVCHLVGLRSGEVLPGRLLALLVEVLHRAALCCFGDTWLSLPDLVEVWDVGAYVVRLWSHVVAPVFREPLVSAVI